MQILRDLHHRPWLIFLTVVAAIFVINLVIKPIFRDEEEDTTPETEQVAQTPAAPDSASSDAEDTTPEDSPAETDDEGPAQDTTASAAGDTARLPLAFPVDCEMGKSCWIGRYLDRGPERRKADFRCNAATEGKHKGTDIAVANLARMAEGVAVKAAAAGTVLRRRDGVEDLSARTQDKSEYAGQECGNAVVINHGNGWETQYCHMRKGSVSARVGDTVNAGDTIGLIGLSGQSEYPHLHFMVRKDGVDRDPFDGGVFEEGCGTGGDALWGGPVVDHPFTLMPIQFATSPPERDAIWEEGPKSLPASAGALLVVGRSFHAQEGDKWFFTITAPDGSVFFENVRMVNQDKQFYYRFVGKNAPEGGFAPGMWRAEVRVSRAEGGQYVQTAQVEITE
jgi:murein DD-endopeptidase MepM/ murein hydrolase activator NlpD